MITFEESDVAEAWEEILGQDEYRKEIRNVADLYPNSKSLFVDYDDIDMYSSDLGLFLRNQPDFCLDIGNKVVMANMPPGWDPKDTITIRIRKLPHDAKVDIRKLRESHLGTLVAIDGLVKKVSSVKPRLTFARFTCSRCGATVWEPQSGMYLREPLMCPNPNGTCNKQANRFILDNKSCRYVNTQKVEIQESPEGLRGGAQPEKISGFMEDDITGIVTPGVRVTLNGIIRPVEKPERDKSTIFDIYVDILSVEFQHDEYEEITITEEDEQAILEMSKNPNLFENIVKSIAPTIYGMDEIKKAIALQLFGGCHKVMDDGTTIRGDTHILLVGDPGVAKSQILRYMSNLAPRSIFTSGKSASAAGLTAAAVKDDFGGDGYTLEAGALVLADKGLACIDELDKMSEQDSASLHEAMESQRISVAKAGITSVLQCRCSLLAAANPKDGRFDTEAETLASQINLPPPLLSRFDLIFVLTDVPDETLDRTVTRFILNVHRRGQALQHMDGENIEGIDLKALKENTSNIKPVIEQEMLRKYVAYSKRFCPVMTESAARLIEDAYMEIRMSGKSKKSIPITKRQLEAYVRLSEASAKMRLSPKVEAQDAKRAIDLISYYLHKVAGRDGGDTDIDRIMSGVSNSQRSRATVIQGIIKAAGNQGISMAQLLESALAEGIVESEVRDTLGRLLNDGRVFNPSSDTYKIVGGQ